MNKLVCDVCGGSIVVLEGGEQGKCEYCGANYSLGRMREIVNGIKVSQTGSAEDIEQWRELVDKYLAEAAFEDAEKIVKKILEASPRDEQANAQYDDLKVLKYFDVRNGIMKSYSGTAEKIVIPPGTRAIEADVFAENQYIHEIVLPEGIKEIAGHSFKGSAIRKITIPSSVEIVGPHAFSFCNQLEEVIIPSSVTCIEQEAFSGCTALRSVSFHRGLKELGDFVFKNCKLLEKVELPDGIEKIGAGVFASCENLRELFIPESVVSIEDKYWGYGSDSYSYISLTPGCKKLTSITYPNQFSLWFFDGTPVCEAEKRKQEAAENAERTRRLQQGNCPYCNIPLSGLFTRKCSKCGRTFK